MKIEILYSPECPNYRAAVEQVEKVLSSESLQLTKLSICRFIQRGWRQQSTEKGA